MRTKFSLGVVRLGAWMAPVLAISFAAACSSSKDSPSPPANTDGGGGGSGGDSGGGGGGGGGGGWRSAVGEHGAFAQTFDEASWAVRQLGPKTFYSVACIGNYVGWVVGEQGGVWYTTDAGKTWTEQDSGTKETIRAVRFFDANHGVLAGDGGTLAVTDDAGHHWRTIPNTPKVTLRGVAASRDLFLAVGDGGTVLRSNDGGATFARQTLANAADLRAVAGDTNARIFLAADGAGHIFASTDRGASFTLEHTASAPLHAITVSGDGDFAIAAGTSGAAFIRTVGGNWRSSNTGTRADLHAALIDSGDWYARGIYWYVAGTGGTLLASPDHGATWKSVPLGITSTLYGLEDL